MMPTGRGFPEQGKRLPFLFNLLKLNGNGRNFNRSRPYTETGANPRRGAGKTDQRPL
jgi:hypothetical protein